MKTYQLQLDINELKAALAFASKDALRYVLNGVICEIDKGGITLVGTDGRRMAAIRAAHDGDIPPACVFVIPRRLIELARPIKKMGSGRWVLTKFTFESDADGLVKTTNCRPLVQFSNLEYTVEMKAVDGNPPAWRPCLRPPATVVKYEGGANRLNFQPLLFSGFNEAAKLLCRKGNVAIQITAKDETAPIHVRLCGVPTFAGVLMPCKNESGDLLAGIPSWLNDPSKDEPKEGAADAP